MKRALATFVATVAGLVILLSIKSHSAHPWASNGVVGSTPSNTPSPPTAGPPRQPAGGGSPGPTQTASTRASGAQPRTVTGASVRTRYGDVQLQVSFTGSRITAITPVRLPDSNGVDQEIDQQAVPILISESLAAQSAHIDAVSGATYTSDGYIRSLQSAIDNAKA